MPGVVLRLVAVAALGLGAMACGDDDRSSATTLTITDATGLALDVPVLDEPPEATGDRVTAEQAEGVSGTVVAAWLLDDQAMAEPFVSEPAVLDELFAREAPSQQLTSGGGGYCSADETGSFGGCSYSVEDDSPDGILALSTEVRVVEGVVLVVSAGFADWND